MTPEPSICRVSLLPTAPLVCIVDLDRHVLPLRSAAEAAGPATSELEAEFARTLREYGLLPEGSSHKSGAGAKKIEDGGSGSRRCVDATHAKP